MPRLTFDELIAHSVALKRVNDTAMRAAICSYTEARYKKIYETTPYAVKQAIPRLADVFGEISLNDLTLEALVSVEMIIEDNQHRKEVCRFLVFACKNHLVSDSRISRLCDFEEFIEKRSIQSGFPFYVMRYPDYATFKASDIYDDRNGGTNHELFRISVPEDVLLSADARNALCKKYQEIKYTSFVQPVTRLQMLRGANQALRAFLETSNIESITGVSAVEFLTKERAVLTYSQMTAVMPGLFIIIEALVEGNVIVDNGLSAAMGIRKQVSNFGYEMFKGIVQSANPDRWCVFALSKYRHKDDIAVRYINAGSECIRKLIVEFFTFKSITGIQVTQFCANFQQSIAPYAVNTVSDFSYYTFEAQVRFFNLIFDGDGEELVTSFYLYIHQNYDSTLFEKDNVSNIILTRQHLGREIASGFTVVNYNPVESFPAADKWLLCYKKSARDTTVRTRAIDFTTIKCQEHRDWIKGYIWSATPAIENRIHPFTIMRECCNRIYEFKTGELMSIFTSKNGEYTSISVKEVEALRNWILSSFDNNRTRNGYVYNCRNLLRFIDINNLGNIESGVYYTLTHTLDNSYDNTNPLSDEELNAVSAVMKKKAEGNVLYGIYYSVFYIALETSFRSSQIVELTKDCVVETAKKGEYVLYSGTKTSAGEYIEQPITTYVEREIREILKLTEEYRQNCTDTSLANKLFIVPGNKSGVYRELSTHKFNAYLRGCCNEAGIPEYTLENLRDTHMTKAEEYVIRNSLSEMHQGVLSGHKHTSTDDIHYVRLGIREMLEAVHGVIIGNVSVDGKILKEASADLTTTENEVSNGCGYCSSESCTNFSYLDCMLCKDFVTTVSRLPYFEEQLKVVDAKLPKSSVPHDKEDLVNIKILLLKYIEEILKIKEADTLGSE